VRLDADPREHEEREGIADDAPQAVTERQAEPADDPDDADDTIRKS
jgi:hypothetical protein